MAARLESRSPLWRESIEPIGIITPESDWVSSLPKVELHLHLEGSMRSETVRDMSYERLGWHGPLPSRWEETYYTFTDFAGFMSQLTPRFPWRPDEYRRIAAECFQDLAAQNVVYAEVSFDAPVTEEGDDRRFWPIVEALEEARREAEVRLPLRVNYIVGIQRSQPVEVALFRAQLAGQARERGMGVVGIDLHGDEENFPDTAAFAPAYRLAADLGLGRRAHAGEAAGAGSVWQAISALRVDRVAHGIRATDDQVLLERLQAGDVTLDLCLTGNVRTGVVPDLAAHPVRRFYDLGIPFTVGSDDPLPFFTDVEREYRLLVDEFGMELPDLHVIARHAAHAAFLPAQEREMLAALIDRHYGSGAGYPATAQ